MLKRNKCIYFFMVAILTFILGISCTNLNITYAGYDDPINFVWCDSSIASDDTVTIRYGMYLGNCSYLGVSVDGQTGDTEQVLSVTSSNENVVTASFNYNNVYEANSYIVNSYNSIILNMKSSGYSVITVSVGDCTRSVTVYVATDQKSDVSSISQNGYNIAKVTWTKASQCTGYILQRRLKGESNYVTVKKISSKSTTYANVTSDWGKTYQYRVIPYCLINNREILSNQIGTSHSFSTKSYGTSLTSVNKTSSSHLKVSWKKISGATGYIIYRSTSETTGFVKVKTINGGSTTSYTDKVSKGKQYYYQIATVYPKCTSNKSDTMCGMYPVNSAVKCVDQSKIKPETARGQYFMNWANPESVFYYTAGGKLYTVVLNGHKLNVYNMNGTTFKATCVKSINIGSFDKFGGFYRGTDGNFYVAVGYNNLSQNNKKTVINVYKYNSSWKKVKTCSIKGNARNSFVGITKPFDAGSCRMTMQGSKLYLTTSREMYAMGGINHQSNICFEINTSTMKYTTPQSVYCSHSFNQYATFNNGDLYVLNHGDAFPRGIQLSILSDYGTSSEKVTTKTVMKIVGKTGDNYTGLTVGGMEVGKDNVMIVGYSDPQSYKIQGVTGASYKYMQNAYVIVANKKTGTSSLRWLTTYNPKKTNVTVGELRMVKLTDDRFAVMYCTEVKSKYTFHYVVLNNAGKTVYSKTYSNVRIEGASQPILYNGKIVWTQSYYINYGRKKLTKTFAIPALY